MLGFIRRRFWAESVSAASAAVLALVTVVWPDWIEIVTDSAPDGGSGALERAVVGGLAATAILLAAVGPGRVAARGRGGQVGRGLA